MQACGTDASNVQTAVSYSIELQQLRKDIDTIIQARIDALVGLPSDGAVLDGDAKGLKQPERPEKPKISARSEDIVGHAFTEATLLHGSESEAPALDLGFSYSESDRRRRADATQTSDLTIQQVKEDKDDTPQGLRPSIRRMVDSHYFDYAFATLVLVSSVVICFEIELDGDDSAQADLKTIAELLNLCFLVELILRISADGLSFFRCGPDATWNYLDSVFVIITLLQYILKLVSDGAWHSKSGQTGLIALRMSRFIRFIKLIRVIRFMRFFRSLRILVYSIFGTIKSLVWAMMLLVLIIYLFAVLFTQAVLEHIDLATRQSSLTQSEEKLLQEFGSIPVSMLTLFKCITGGMNWEIAANLLDDVDPVCVVILLAYVTFAILAVLNVITGFFCHSAIQHAESEDEEVIQSQLKAIDEWRSKFQDIFTEIDEFNFGKFTLKQFEEYCDNDRVRSYFETLGLDVSDAWRIFKILDADGSNTIEVGEFVDGCLHMKGAATRLDAKEILVVTKRLMDQMASLMDAVESSMRRFKSCTEDKRPDLLNPTCRPSGSGSSVTRLPSCESDEISRYPSFELSV